MCIAGTVLGCGERRRISGALADNRPPAAPDGAPAGMLPIDYWDAWGEGGGGDGGCRRASPAETGKREGGDISRQLGTEGRNNGDMSRQLTTEVGAVMTSLAKWD